MSSRILIVDDDHTITTLFSLDCETRDDDVLIQSAANGEEAITMIGQNTPNAIVLDLRMAKGDGFSVLEHLEQTGAGIPVVVLTNYRSKEYMDRCKQYGVKDYLIKVDQPMSRIVDTVRRVLE